MTPGDLPSAGADAVLDTGPPAATLRGKAWFWAPIVPLVALDLWSKAAAFAYVEAHGSRAREVAFDFLPEPFGFSLVRYENTGTIWGIAQDMTVPLMVLRCAALGVIVWFAARTEVRQRIQVFVLALIFAGAVGNLYDNFFMEGRGVRDFLLFFMVGEGGVRHVFPAFNVADSCISVGAISLMVLLWLQPAKKAVPDAGAKGGKE